MSLMHNPPHPGEVLREWLAGHTTTEAAEKLGVVRVTLSSILNGAASISAEMDLRLSHALGTSPGFWLRLQDGRDPWIASKTLKGKVRKIIPDAERIANAA